MDGGDSATVGKITSSSIKEQAMSIKLITEDAALSTLKTLDIAVSKQAVNQSLSENESGQPVQSKAVDANFNNKVFSVTKLSPEVGIENQKNSVRAMSHIVEVYNQQGKVRTKFMDSKNNVIYQIPTEMVAKLEDQMMNQNTSTSTKG